MHQVVQCLDLIKAVTDAAFSHIARCFGGTVPSFPPANNHDFAM